MVHRGWQLFPIFLVLVLALVLVGCAKQPVTITPTAATPAPGAPGPAAVPAPPAPAPLAPKVEAPVVAEAPPAPVTPPPPAEFTAVEALKDIHFDFDKYNIRPGDAKVLDESAAWIKANPGYLILIEGHCDERGTNDYNLALGERRAKATLSYLVSQGVEADRITLISYGKERPLCTEKNEECWAKNRRAHFLAKVR